LVGPLRELGHRVVTPPLPLGDPEADSVQRAQPAIDALAGSAGQVVVVGHSTSSGYAALVAAAHPGSLLIHLCPRMGQFPVPSTAPPPFRDGMRFPPERPDGTSVWEPESAIALMYPRLDQALARGLARREVPFAMPPGEFPLDSHPAVPTALVYASEDEFFEPSWERFVARELLGVEPIEVPGGHFPMLERPGELAALLDRLARDAADAD
jgi:pimeloyl-ACP methyl ester carboxylesterase